METKRLWNLIRTKPRNHVESSQDSWGNKESEARERAVKLDGWSQSDLTLIYTNTDRSTR